MSIGFLTNADAVTAIGNTFALAKVIPITSITSVDGAEIDFTQGCYLDHLEIDGTNTGAVTSLSAYLTWDAAGDDRATATGTVTMEAGITTTTLLGGVCVIDAWVRPPGKKLTLYLWIKTNANQIAIAAGGARVHWTDSFRRS